MLTALRTQLLTFWQKLGRTQRTLLLVLVITPVVARWVRRAPPVE